MLLSKKRICGIFKQFLFGVLQLLYGNIWNRVGLSILLFLLALVGMFSPVVDSNGEMLAKPCFFYFVGAALVVASVYLIYAHWSEKRRKKDGNQSAICVERSKN
jgi:hypothetical protein